MNPIESILNKAILQVNSPFTKEIMPLGVVSKNKNQFIVSVLNQRGGKEILIDYYFTIKTAKMVKSNTIYIK